MLKCIAIWAIAWTFSTVGYCGKFHFFNNNDKPIWFYVEHIDCTTVFDWEILPKQLSDEATGIADGKTECGVKNIYWSYSKTWDRNNWTLVANRSTLERLTNVDYPIKTGGIYRGYWGIDIEIIPGEPGKVTVEIEPKKLIPELRELYPFK